MKKSDSIVVRDRAGRRAFFRAGAAVVLAGSGVAQAQEPLRYDCDSQGFAGEKNVNAEGNDSDTGATADRPGCGRRQPPAMSDYRKKRDGAVRVRKVKA
jgi:hypothetical protein